MPDTATANSVFDQPTSPSLPSSSSKAPSAASPAEGVSGADLIELLRLARAYVPSLTSLALEIDDAIGRRPTCVFCGSGAHLAMDCRAAALTDLGRSAS